MECVAGAELWSLRNGRRRLMTGSHYGEHRRTPVRSRPCETSPSGSGLWPGKPTLKEAQLPTRRKTVQEANALRRNPGTGLRDLRSPRSLSSTQCRPNEATAETPAVGPAGKDGAV